MKTPPKSNKSKPTSLRHQVLAAVLSEAGRQAVKLVGTVAIAVIMQHLGAPEVSPGILLV